MKKTIGLSYAAALSSLGVAARCVLPMTMLLLGIGGSWLAIFAQMAAFSGIVLAVSTILVLAAWYIAFRRSSISDFKFWLGGVSLMMLIAWLIFLNESRINDHLITLM